jgi:hypothetical protein
MDSMMNQKTVLAVTDDVVLPVSSVLAIMKELGKEVIESFDPLIITQASTISKSLFLIVLRFFFLAQVMK